MTSKTTRSRKASAEAALTEQLSALEKSLETNGLTKERLARLETVLAQATEAEGRLAHRLDKHLERHDEIPRQLDELRVFFSRALWQALEAHKRETRRLCELRSGQLEKDLAEHRSWHSRWQMSLSHVKVSILAAVTGSVVGVLVSGLVRWLG